MNNDLRLHGVRPVGAVAKAFHDRKQVAERQPQAAMFQGIGIPITPNSAHRFQPSWLNRSSRSRDHVVTQGRAGEVNSGYL